MKNSDNFIIEGKIHGNCLETIVKLKCCDVVVYSFFTQLPVSLDDLTHNCKSTGEKNESNE